MNLTYVFEHGDPVLITTFCLLILMSLASWYIIFWKAWSLRQERKNLASFRANHAQRTDWPRRLGWQQSNGCLKLLTAEADRHRISTEGQSSTQRKAALEMHLSQSLDVVKVWLDRGLTVLASVGSSAPFIGLFGTVWGIYGALTRIAAEGNASLNVVAGPMGEALVATAVGLFAAIPAVLAYNAFVRQNRLLVQDFRHIAEQLAFYLAQENESKPLENVKHLQGIR